MEKLILSTIDINELKEEILKGVSQLLEHGRTKSINEKTNWTAQETADYLRVSKVTVHNKTKEGVLKKYKIGNRIFYKKSEVLKAINKMEY